jgi:hypothetical protein
MKLVGCMPIRNEDWVLGLSLRVALLWCDEVVVLLHACTDRSAMIAREVSVESGSRVRLLFYGGEWNEMEHRQLMLETARKRGATHLSIIDADEVLTGNLIRSEDPERHSPIRYTVESAEYLILELPGYNLHNGIDQYHSNGVWGNRWFSTAFQDAPDLGWSGDRFHHRAPGPRELKPYRPIQQGQGGIMHLWGASERRLIAKHRAYRITETLRWPDKPHAEIERMYSWATDGEAGNAAIGTPATWTYVPVPESWLAPYSHLMKYLDLDSEPWQEQWCEEQIALHGRERFSGLRV